MQTTQNAGRLDYPESPTLGNRLDVALDRLASTVDRAKAIREAILGPEPASAGEGNPQQAMRSLEARVSQFESYLEALEEELQRISVAI